MGKVLIIDDEKQILSLLSRIIGLEGYEVFQATNCKVGIKQLNRTIPKWCSVMFACQTGAVWSLSLN